MTRVMGDPNQLEELRSKIGDLSALAPQGPEENNWFVAVAITAGVCEEILYRGILMAALDPMMLISGFTQGVMESSRSGTELSHGSFMNWWLPHSAIFVNVPKNNSIG